MKRKFKQFLFLFAATALIFTGAVTWKWGLWERKWDGKTRLTVVVIGADKELSLWSYLPAKQIFTVLPVPHDLFLEAVNEKGKVRAGKLYDLGQLDKRGEELVQFTLQKELGVLIDGVNLPPIDLIQFKLLKALKKAETINIPDLTELILADGEKVYVLNYDSIDKIISKYFYDPKIENEQAKIIIMNATGKEGSGGKLARILTNTGYSVSYIGNKDIYLSRTKITAPYNNLSVNKIRSLMKVNSVEIVKDSADITIEIGTDYLRYQ